jgi:hypothetical protein
MATRTSLSIVLRETIRKGPPRFAPRVFLYLSIYLSQRIAPKRKPVKTSTVCVSGKRVYNIVLVNSTVPQIFYSPGEGHA